MARNRRRFALALDPLPARLAPSAGVPMAETRPLPPDDSNLPGQDPPIEVAWGPTAPDDPAPIAPVAVDPRDGMTTTPE